MSNKITCKKIKGKGPCISPTFQNLFHISIRNTFECAQSLQGIGTGIK